MTTGPAVLRRAILLFGVLATQQIGISRAEWVQANGPKGGTIRSLVAVPSEDDGTRLYAGQIRLWSTDDAGASWTHLGLVHGMQAAGERHVTWDGKTESGLRVGRGVYLYRLEAGGTIRTRKMIVE